MNAAFAMLLLGLIPPLALHSPPQAWRFQGRASVVRRVAQRATQCGVRNFDLQIMRGALPFHDPDEPGAELTIPATAMTAVAKACINWKTGSSKSN